MKLERGKGDYPAPPVGRVIRGMLDMRGHLYEMMLVGPEQIDIERAKSPEPLLGEPVMFALSPVYECFMFFPAPDADLKAMIWYYPPVAEI